MFVSMCFKIISKVVKYTCRLRRYNYTHDQLNTIDIIYIIIFLGIFLRGGRKIQVCPRAPDTLATPLVGRQAEFFFALTPPPPPVSAHV